MMHCDIIVIISFCNLVLKPQSKHDLNTKQTEIKIGVWLYETKGLRISTDKQINNK